MPIRLKTRVRSKDRGTDLTLLLYRQVRDTKYLFNTINVHSYDDLTCLVITDLKYNKPDTSRIYCVRETVKNCALRALIEYLRFKDDRRFKILTRLLDPKILLKKYIHRC